MSRLIILFLCTGLVASNQTFAQPPDVNPQARNVRMFIVFNYRRLALNIVDRRGVYLDALEQLIAPDCRTSATSNMLSDLLVQHADQVEFAVAVAEHCMPPPRLPVPKAAQASISPPVSSRFGALGV